MLRPVFSPRDRDESFTADRHPEPYRPRPAHLGDRPLQPAVRLLHAGRGHAVAGARGPALLRGDHALRRASAWGSASPGSGSPAASRPCAWTCRVWCACSTSYSPGSISRSRPTASSSPPWRASWPPPASRRVNVSLDTLRPERFLEIARRDRFHEVIAGLEAARRVGFAPIKVNVVLMRGFNQDEAVDLARFGARSRLRAALHRVDAARLPALVDARATGPGGRDPRAHPRGVPARGGASHRSERAGDALPLPRRSRHASA